MASGRTHELMNLVFLPPALYFVPKEVYVPFTAGYLLGTFLLSPDMDMGHSKPAKRWKLLKHLWSPYRAFSKHRGMSHLPVIGSLIRLLYLILAFIFIYFVLLGAVSLIKPELTSQLLKLNPLDLINRFALSQESAYLIFGIALADIAHVFIDVVSSKLKHR